MYIYKIFKNILPSCSRIYRKKIDRIPFDVTKGQYQVGGKSDNLKKKYNMHLKAV